ncbi:MAG: hypothetical protein K9J74_04630 [Sulfuritalea sp.]|nr:hypothetical protein [Sulfuritalea sp.]
MAEKVENLMLEHLKRFQAGQERIEQKLDEVIYRLGQLEVGIAAVRRDVAHGDEFDAGLSVRFDNIAKRMERIEKRLELAN